MKLLNIFKKNTKKSIITTAEKLNKKQLEKVIGGIDNMSTSDRKSGSVVAADYEYR